MAKDLGQVLGPSLNAGPVPESGPALVDYAGGRHALVQQVTGRDHAPRRSEFRDAEQFERARTEWRSASRNAQRWDKGRRPTREGLPSSTRGKIRREANKRHRAELARRGLRARLHARVRVPSPMSRRGGDERDRVMPAGGPGVYLDGGTVGEILEELADEGRDAAAEVFLGAFFEAYGMPEDAELVAVYSLKVWPEGTEEPA